MPTFTESFNKADGAGLGSDLTWVPISAGMGTVSGNASATTAGVNAQELVTGDIGSLDRYIETTITAVGSQHYCDLQSIIRYTDASNYAAVLRAFSTTIGGQCVIYRSVVGGTLTDTGVLAAFTGPTETLRVEASGTTIRALINGVEVGSWTTSITGTAFGLGGFRSATGATRLIQTDLYTAGPLTEPPVTFPLTTSVVGNGTVDPASGDFTENSTIPVDAIPDSGWEFAGWSGDAAGTDNPLSLLMDSAKSITATFTEIPPTGPSMAQHVAMSTRPHRWWL